MSMVPFGRGRGSKAVVPAGGQSLEDAVEEAGDNGHKNVILPGKYLCVKVALERQGDAVDWHFELDSGSKMREYVDLEKLVYFSMVFHGRRGEIVPVFKERLVRGTHSGYYKAAYPGVLIFSWDNRHVKYTSKTIQHDIQYLKVAQKFTPTDLIVSIAWRYEEFDLSVLWVDTMKKPADHALLKSIVATHRGVVYSDRTTKDLENMESIKTAMYTRSLEGVRGGLARMRIMGLDYRPEYKEGEKMLPQLAKEKATQRMRKNEKMIVEMMETPDRFSEGEMKTKLDNMEAALSEMRLVGMADSPEHSDGQLTMTKVTEALEALRLARAQDVLKQQQQCVDALMTAIQLEDLQAIEKALLDMQQMGLSERDEFKKGEQIRGRLQGAQDTEAFRMSQKNKTWLHPQSKYMRRWDMVMMIALLFTATITPYEVAFLESKLDLLFGINRIMDCCFTTDIFLNFFLAYYDSRHTMWILNKDMIKRHYLRTWFPIDALSTFPYDVLGFTMQSDSAGSLAVLRVLKLLKLMKLLRMLKSSRVFNRVIQLLSLSGATTSLLQFLMILIMIVHFAACMWRMIPEMEGAEYNWMNATADAGITDRDDPGSLYVVCVEMSMMVMTMSYGVAAPQTNLEVGAAVIFQIVCASIYCYVVGQICNVISNLDPASTKYAETMDLLKAYVDEQHMVPELRWKIFNYFSHCRGLFRNQFYQESVMQNMSPELTKEVAMTLNGKQLLKCVPYFRSPSKSERRQFVTEVCLRLVPLAFAPDETICAAGEECERLYIAQKGVASGGGRIFSKGRVFGNDIMIGFQSPLLTEWQRNKGMLEDEVDDQDNDDDSEDDLGDPDSDEEDNEVDADEVAEQMEGFMYQKSKIHREITVLSLTFFDCTALDRIELFKLMWMKRHIFVKTAKTLRRKALRMALHRCIRLLGRAAMVSNPPSKRMNRAEVAGYKARMKAKAGDMKSGDSDMLKAMRKGLKSEKQKEAEELRKEAEQLANARKRLGHEHKLEERRRKAREQQMNPEDAEAVRIAQKKLAYYTGKVYKHGVLSDFAVDTSTKDAPTCWEDLELDQPSPEEIAKKLAERLAAQDVRLTRQVKDLSGWIDGQVAPMQKQLERRMVGSRAKMFRRLTLEMEMMKVQFGADMKSYRKTLASTVQDDGIPPVITVDTCLATESKVDLGANGILFTIDAVKGGGKLPVLLEAIWVSSKCTETSLVSVYVCDGTAEASRYTRPAWRKVGEGICPGTNPFDKSKSAVSSTAKDGVGSELIRVEFCKKAGGGFGLPPFIAPGHQLGVYLHSTHSYGVGINLNEDVDPIVEDPSLKVRMGSAVYDKGPWQFMLDKVAKRSMRSSQAEKEKEDAEKEGGAIKDAEPEDEDEDEDAKGEESEEEQDALALKVSFAGKLEYSLQAMAFADM